MCYSLDCLGHFFLFLFASLFEITVQSNGFHNGIFICNMLLLILCPLLPRSLSPCALPPTSLLFPVHSVCSLLHLPLPQTLPLPLHVPLSSFLTYKYSPFCVWGGWGGMIHRGENLVHCDQIIRRFLRCHSFFPPQNTFFKSHLHIGVTV